MVWINVYCEYYEIIACKLTFIVYEALGLDIKYVLLLLIPNFKEVCLLLYHICFILFGIHLIGQIDCYNILNSTNRDLFRA